MNWLEFVIYVIITLLGGISSGIISSGIAVHYFKSNLDLLFWKKQGFHAMRSEAIREAYKSCVELRQMIEDLNWARSHEELQEKYKSFSKKNRDTLLNYQANSIVLDDEVKKIAEEVFSQLQSIAARVHSWRYSERTSTFPKFDESDLKKIENFQQQLNDQMDRMAAEYRLILSGSRWL